jgi:hypothetical protein
MSEPDVRVIYDASRPAEPETRKVDIPRGMVMHGGPMRQSNPRPPNGNEKTFPAPHALVDAYGKPLAPTENTAKKKERDTENGTSSARVNGLDASDVLAAEIANDPEFIDCGEDFSFDGKVHRVVKAHEFLITQNRVFTPGPMGILRAIRVRPHLAIICQGSEIIGSIVNDSDVLMERAEEIMEGMQRKEMEEVKKERPWKC